VCAAVRDGLEDSLAGKSVKCPSCSAVVKIPVKSEAAAGLFTSRSWLGSDISEGPARANAKIAPLVPADEKPTLADWLPTRRNRTRLWLAAGGIGVLAASVVWMIVRSGKFDENERIAKLTPSPKLLPSQSTTAPVQQTEQPVGTAAILEGNHLDDVTAKRVLACVIAAQKLALARLKKERQSVVRDDLDEVQLAANTLRKAMKQAEKIYDALYWDHPESRDSLRDLFYKFRDGAFTKQDARNATKSFPTVFTAFLMEMTENGTCTQQTIEERFKKHCEFRVRHFETFWEARLVLMNAVQDWVDGSELEVAASNLDKALASTKVPLYEVNAARAAVALMQRDLATVKTQSEQSIAHESYNPHSYLLRAFYWRAKRERAQAVADYRQAIQQLPNLSSQFGDFFR
jgi:hypothetical protein